MRRFSQIIICEYHNVLVSVTIMVKKNNSNSDNLYFCFYTTTLEHVSRNTMFKLSF